MAARKKRIEKKILEIVKSKPKKEEQKFFAQFSGTQLTAVSLIILSATFLVQGIVKYFEIIQRTDLLSKWFTLIILALIFLAFSVLFITLNNIIASLKEKRLINVLGFLSFILGFVLFLGSLAYILYLI